MAKYKVDYPALEREYLNAEETPSLREIAKREGISNSTLSDYARKHTWSEKRADLKQRELDAFLQATAEKNARRLARMSDITVDVLEGTLIRFAEQLTQHLDEQGKPNNKDPIFISAKDVQEAIKLIRDLAGSRRSEESDSSAPNVTINIDRGLLDAVGELARGSLLAGRAERARPVALPGGATAPAGSPAERESA